MGRKALRMALAMTLVLASSTMTGCGERGRSSEEFNKLSRAFEAKMDKGETTREQEQAYVRATSKLAYELDRSIRGNTKADRARKEAESILNGFRPSDPLRMDRAPRHEEEDR